MKQISVSQWKRWELWNAVYMAFQSTGATTLTFESLAAQVQKQGAKWNYATMVQCCNGKILQQEGSARYTVYRLICNQDPEFDPAAQSLPNKVEAVISNMSSTYVSKATIEVIDIKPIDYKSRYEQTEAARLLIEKERDQLRLQVAKLEKRVEKLASSLAASREAKDDLTNLAKILYKYLQ